MAQVWKLAPTFALCFLFLTLTAHGQNAATSTPIAPSDMTSAASPAPAPPVNVGTGGDSAVRLGNGDLIEVNVYNVPELNTTTRVRSAGDVYLP
jgi:protein involved in polysaccharide export with SLBB domain